MPLSRVADFVVTLAFEPRPAMSGLGHLVWSPDLVTVGVILGTLLLLLAIQTARLARRRPVPETAGEGTQLSNGISGSDAAEPSSGAVEDALQVGRQHSLNNLLLVAMNNLELARLYLKQADSAQALTAIDEADRAVEMVTERVSQPPQQIAAASPPGRTRQAEAASASVLPHPSIPDRPSLPANSSAPAISSALANSSALAATGNAMLQLPQTQPGGPIPTYARHAAAGPVSELSPAEMEAVAAASPSQAIWGDPPDAAGHNDPLGATSVVELDRSTWRIGVVDDEDSVRKSLGVLLEGMGNDVDLFDSGLSLFDHLKLTPNAFDVVIVDWSMPGLAGREMLGRLRLEFPELPVIITSGIPLDNDRLHSTIGVSATAILQKPFTQQQLEDNVRFACQNMVRGMV